jgi:hypothetical protein
MASSRPFYRPDKTAAAQLSETAHRSGQNLRTSTWATIREFECVTSQFSLSHSTSASYRALLWFLFLAGPDEYQATCAAEARGDWRKDSIVEIEHAHDAGGIGSGICCSRFEAEL